MSNRAYLYSIDKIPSASQRPTKCSPLVEWGGAVCVSQMVLIGPAPFTCESLVFGGARALAGNLRSGVERYQNFLDRLAPYSASDDAFAKEIQMTRRALETTSMYPVAFLEVAEIYDSEEIERMAQRHIPAFHRELEKDSESFYKRKAGEWKDLGLGKFGALYFTLPLAEEERHSFSSDRIKGIAEILARADRFERTQIQGRIGVKIWVGGGTQISLLSPGEYEELRVHFTVLE